MIWIAGWYVVMSLITFVMYGLDKRKARVDHWRIKESTLHGLELLCGWPGGLAGQHYFRHKWKKANYMLVFWFIVVLHLALWAMVIYHRQR